ncbi:MAG: class I SAM-dependent methyltransferase [Caldilinea sp.]|uniref:class I SAM-dependent methyltransferase n=1 Tax=Caldilinea sp. TaxID=2293560 RepID=UPI0030999CBE
MNIGQVNPRQYWEKRLYTQSSLRGTGHRAFNEDYNQILYRSQAECLDSLFAEALISPSGHSVFDVGSGTGYFIRYYQDRGASVIVGADLTYASVTYLKQHLDGVNILQCDITAPNLPIRQEFDIVNCISVLYHILDDALFARALTNLCQSVAKNGFLIVSDIFRHAYSARHARFRPLEAYETILRSNHLSIVTILPVYFFLNRVFIPVVGPKLVEIFQLGEWFYHIDRRLRQKGVKKGASMYFLLAKRI